MKRRIKQLIESPVRPVVALREFAILTAELEAQIQDDIDHHRLLTYVDIAAKLGCTPEKARLDAQGYPVLKHGKLHQVPDCVYRLIVRRRLSVA
jgi:hypothetical protein